MQSWSEPCLQTSNLHSSSNITFCCSFHISTMQSMQNWSHSICKPIISIPNLARTSLQTRDQNWSDSICKPVISVLNLVRTSLQTSDLHSSSSISHVAAHFGYQPSNALFILHQSYHTLNLVRTSLQTSSLHSSSSISHAATHFGYQSSK